MDFKTKNFHISFFNMTKSNISRIKWNGFTLHSLAKYKVCDSLIDWRLRIAYYVLQITYYGLRIADYILRIA